MHMYGLEVWLSLSTTTLYWLKCKNKSQNTFLYSFAVLVEIFFFFCLRINLILILIFFLISISIKWLCYQDFSNWLPHNFNWTQNIILIVSKLYYFLNNFVLSLFLPLQNEHSDQISKAAFNWSVNWK